MGEVSSQLNRESLDIASSPVSPAQLALVIQRIADGTISNKIAKDIFQAIWEEKATDDSRRRPHHRSEGAEADLGYRRAGSDHRRGDGREPEVGR